MWREIKGATINRRLQDLIADIATAELEHVPIRLYLPNLRCRSIDIGGGLAGQPLRIAATVENVGQRRSRECGVQAQVWLSAANQTHVLTARCPALDPASSFRVELGSIPNVAENQFVNVTVMVDPPTAARPGGEVWESNEEDNARFDGVYLAPAPLEPLPEEFPEGPERPEPPEPPIRK
ncbi:MAG: hypothetical protein KIT09_32540 [Bryobacteraceae bacterium]|nr:hypothetical protein [Bryobacteraceae bacterium]